MIEKIRNIMHDLHGKKVAVAYAGLMLMACILIYTTWVASGNSLWKSQEEKEQIANNRDKARVAYGKCNIIQGDITDRNGKVLIHTENTEESSVYKDAEAYTQALGFTGVEDRDYLLVGANRDILYDALEDTDKGCTIQTTLDADLQEYCYHLLNNGDGREGSIAVLEVDTGRVLTWANTPSFDVAALPEAYKKAEEGMKVEAITETTDDIETKAEPLTFEDIVEEQLNSRIYPMLYPRMPGSVFKIITSIAVIENDCDGPIEDISGEYYAGNATITNFDKSAWGTTDFRTAFSASSNIYFAQKAVEEIGKSKLDEVAKRCGLDKNMLFDFGRMVSNYGFEDDAAELARTAIGQQNVQMSAMHVAMLTAGVANNGQVPMPHMIQEISRTRLVSSVEEKSYEKGDVVEEEKIDRNFMEIMKPETAKRLREEMVAAGDYSEVELTIDGTKLSMGSKTGTAEIELANHEISDGVNIWLTSYVPADNPKYVVVMNRYDVKPKMINGRTVGRYGSELYDDVIHIYEKIYELENKEGGSENV